MWYDGSDFIGREGTAVLTLILGRSGTGKTAAVLERLVRAGEERPQVLMVPEQRSHETERALCPAKAEEGQDTSCSFPQ